MFKFIDFTGLLTAPITDADTVLPITVDNKICLEIEASEDFTIFKISDDIHVEYVKVIDCNPDFTVNVEREFFEDYPAVPFGAGACVDGVCCDEVVLDWFICQSNCLDSIVCNIKTDTPTFFNIHRDTENNCEVIINFLGYIPGTGIDILNNTISVNLCSFEKLAEEDLLSTDEFIVCKNSDLYNLSLADLCSYILDKIVTGGDGLVLGFELPIVNKGTAENPIVGMEEIYSGNQSFLGGIVDKFGRVTSIGTGSLPTLSPGTFPNATVTVAAGVITNVAAGSTNIGVESLLTGPAIVDTGDLSFPDIDLVEHYLAAFTAGPFTINKYGIISSSATITNQLNILDAIPPISKTDGASTTIFEHDVSGITPGIYNGFTINEHGHVVSYAPPGPASPGLVVSMTTGQFTNSTTYILEEDQNCTTISGSPDTITMSFDTPYATSNYHVSVVTETGVPGYSIVGRAAGSVTITLTPSLLNTKFFVSVTGYA